MAVSATPRTAEAAVPRLIAVAYSGGRDSTALLHATASAALLLGLQVLALHVHHGLSAQADAWLRHCETQVAAWAAGGLPVSLCCERLKGAPQPGESIEAWAREQRHLALQRLALQAGADLLLLAHHRRDQAETFVLQALRAAGVAGLAAMPSAQRRDGLVWARPWLAQPREAIEAYVHQHGLSHIEDDSNGDPRYARNRLRLQVWPALTAGFAQAEASLAQAAQWAQQALELQREMAAEDLRAWTDEQGLKVGLLQALSPARASNALRAWLADALGQAAPASLVRRLRDELPRAQAGHWPAPGGQLRLYRGHLGFRPQASTRAAVAAAAIAGPWSGPLDLSQPGLYPLPGWGGSLLVRALSAGQEGGVAASVLRKSSLRPREGSTQFQAVIPGCPRSLKKCWQAVGVPADERTGPLVYTGDRLVFVPHLGLDARIRGEPGEPRLTLDWLPDSD